MSGFGLRWQAERDTAFEHRTRHARQKRRRRCALPAHSKTIFACRVVHKHASFLNGSVSPPLFRESGDIVPRLPGTALQRCGKTELRHYARLNCVTLAQKYFQPAAKPLNSGIIGWHAASLIE